MANPIHQLSKRISDLEARMRALEARVDQPREHYEKSIHKKDSTHQQENPVTGSLAVQTAPKNDDHASDGREASKQWWKRAWAKICRIRWMSVLQVVGIIAGIIYAAVTYYQWQDLRHNFEADERSWVKVRFGWTQAQVGSPAVATATLTNAGKSPVTELYAEGVFEVVDGAKSPSFTLKQPHSTYSEVLLFPSDHSEFSISLMDSTKKPRSLTPEEVDKLKQGRAYIATFGWIIYADQFGRHWYRFCGWTGSADAPFFSEAHAGECVTWNRIGDGKLDVPIQ